MQTRTATQTARAATGRQRRDALQGIAFMASDDDTRSQQPIRRQRLQPTHGLQIDVDKMGFAFVIQRMLITFITPFHII
jgi:hypothetical protein